LDGLAAIGTQLGTLLKMPVNVLWAMQNGYDMCYREGLDAIAAWLDSATPREVDDMRGQLRIGLHHDVEVTDVDGPPQPVVSQAFCSALAVAYGDIPKARWRGFASMVLEAAYEATLWAAVANAQRGASRTVLLTLVGGGAFGRALAGGH